MLVDALLCVLLALHGGLEQLLGILLTHGRLLLLLVLLVLLLILLLLLLLLLFLLVLQILLVLIVLTAAAITILV